MSEKDTKYYQQALSECESFFRVTIIKSMNIRLLKPEHHAAVCSMILAAGMQILAEGMNSRNTPSIYLIIAVR